MIPYYKFFSQLHLMFSQDSDFDRINLETILASIPRIDQLQEIPVGGVVLVRADLDVEIKDGKVLDASRIQGTLRTIIHCINKGWKVVLVGHIGRDMNNSLRPIQETLSAELGHPIEFISDWIDGKGLRLLDRTVSMIREAHPGTVIMLENIRKYSIERALWEATEEDFSEICKKMYLLGQDLRNRLTGIEINEAIAASNFDFSSSVLPLVMSQTALGFYTSEEMNVHIKAARRANMVVISSDQKVDKLDNLEGILERGKIKWVITAGSVAMALKKAQAQLRFKDFCIGRVESDSNAIGYISLARIEQAKRIIRRCREDKVDLSLPVDFVLDNGEAVEEIPPDRVQYDIGPRTRELISNKVSEYIYLNSQSPEPFTMVWNGAFGKFEDTRYAAGTREFIALLGRMTRAGILTYVGGGESRLVLLKYGHISDVTHVFTAGGTILKSLSDRTLPFLKAMYLQNTGWLNT